MGAVDGGWGWMVLIGAFVSYFISDGWAYSFGLLFPKMADYFEESKGNTALIPTLLYGIPMIISPVVCAMTTVFGFRKVALLGSLLTCLSMVLASCSSSFVFLCLNIGVLSGIGFAMIYVPSIVAVTCYFDKRRGLAMGLAVTGSGLGSFAFPLLMVLLMENYAWRGMLLIMGGICLELLVAGSLYRPLEEPKNAIKVEGESDESKRVNKYSGVLNKSEIPLNIMKTKNSIDLQNVDSKQNFELLEHAKQNQNETTNCTVDDVTHVVKETKLTNVSNNLKDEITDKHKDRQMASTSLRDQPPLESRNYLRRKAQRFCQELRLMIAAMFDKSVLSDRSFQFFCGANFITYLWISVPYVYLVDKAIVDLKIDEDKAGFLLSIIGIARTVGQILIGIVGDFPCMSSNLLYGIGLVVIGFGSILVPFCGNYVSLGVYSAVFGTFVSVTYVLPMMCLVEILTLEKATNAFGFLQFAQGLGTLIGTPIIGFVYDLSGGYNISFFVAGAWILISGIAVCFMPLVLGYSRRHSNNT